MGLLEKARFHLWDGRGMIVSLIEKWSPKRFGDEGEYEKSLYGYLHDNLEEIQVTRQYSKGRVRADIVVGEQILIELKHNFDSTSKYHRLIGQLSEYKKWQGYVIIILCGKTDSNLRKMLKEHIKQEFSQGFGLLPTMTEDGIKIIEKR